MNQPPSRPEVNVLVGQVPGQLIDLDAVEILGSEPFSPGDMLERGSWICAACGQRRSIEGSWQIRVRNRSGMSLERPVLVCGDCHDRIVRADRR